MVWVGIGIAAVILLIVAMRVFYLPMGPSVPAATAFSRQTRWGSEPGNPVSVRCRHTGWLGLFGDTDACTLHYATGDIWSCSVGGPADYVGLFASCDGPFRATSRR